MSVIKTKGSDGKWVPLNVLRGEKGDPGKDATMPVGFEYFQTNPNIRAGSLPLTGGVYSRTIYADLWAWVQKQTGYLITEAEWQDKAAVNNGAVPFYSAGDDSTTFRVPALTVWCKGANGDEAIGDYLADTFASHKHNVASTNVEQFSDRQALGDTVITTYRSGASWYRLYKSGWIEQGGSGSIKENTTVTVTLHKAMANKNYSAIIINTSGKTSNNAEGALFVKTKNTGSVVFSSGYIDPNTSTFNWEVRGQSSAAPTDSTGFTVANATGSVVTITEQLQGATETRPKTIVGIYCVTAFGVTTSSGAVSLDDIKEVLDGTDERLESITARINEAEELFNKGALPVGFEYIQNNPTPRLGSLPLSGDTYSRKEYAALWEWAQSQAGYVIAESDWQTKKADNVSVPYYSDGDGSTTFRVPNLTVRTYVVAVNSDKVEGSISLEALYSSISEAKNVMAAANTVRLVGEQWVSVHGIIPKGGVPYCGQEVPRAMYADLWQWVNDNNLVITEAEWQALNTSQNGNVTKYSDGDGSTTFRMPKIVGYFRGASTLAETGSYIKEGLPNITGVSSGNQDQYGSVSGAFYVIKNGLMNSGANPYATLEGFDASRSNPIYGNSSHVTPETSVVMFGVYAFGEIANQGSLDATTLASALAKVEANIASLPSPNDYIVETYRNGTEWYEVYKSGKVRQGGYITKKGVGASHTFLKPFADTNFALLVTPLTTYQGVEWPHYIFANTRTRTGFTFDSTNHKELHYIAEGQGA